MTNPYAAPTADLSRVIDDGQTYTPSMYALRGRIGRVRYIAYASFCGLALLFLGAVLSGFIVMLWPSLSLLSMIAYIPAIVVGFAFAARRFNDMNQSGWWSLMLVIPLVNMFASLWLVFGPGSAGSNRYGPAPTANTKIIIWGAVLPLLLAVAIGVVAAVALPTYLKYSEKARAAFEGASVPVVPVESTQP